MCSGHDAANHGRLCHLRVLRLFRALAISSHFSDFRLSVSRALKDQLVAEFNALTPIALTGGALTGNTLTGNAPAVPQTQGVYRLHYPTPQVTYVGKADDLRDRLTQHLRNLGGRTGLVMANIGFTFVTVEEDLTTIAPETVMIRYHGTASAWNGSGFGSRDPGRNRDNSKPGKFDTDYPIDLDYVPGLPAGSYTARDLIKRLQGTLWAAPALPYRLRAEGNMETTYEAAQVSVSAEMTASDLMQALVASLNAVAGQPAEWQATAFPGHMILYRERPTGGPNRAYPYSIKRWP